ncbi:MAG: type II toxin-antitoxin system HicB family antitoxin [Thermomicrobiales bacterium]|nr:type II toxin-antitoxin system HicB family antitoxin [Thermomicrobiales bacterium]MCO5217962.1 type II toxin-antitoxin system HicB family antitoxin [Thermomicrobiales bacterium]MCO5224241.1 type II toxin-antitoxin system HicB family antitoxin [Thermomicrobiales bacterium]MCO5229361.1 type II toxin-antitoxin system HicB family antitoxin [Thermomicrobiales bacterium]
MSTPTMNNYPFVVTPDPDSPDEWLVIFPDLKGCMGSAESLQEIGEVAREVFDLWMHMAMEHGDPIPAPARPPSRGVPDWAQAAFPVGVPNLTANDVARILGISARRVRAIAQSRGIGERFNRTVMFFQEDIDRLRPNNPGRPANP